MDEKEWIRQAQQGDKLALSMLLRHHYAFLMKYLIKITLQPQLAEDLTQETMVRCMEKIRLYNGQSKFSSWLVTIATNLYIDHQRRRKREWNWQEQEQSLRKMRWHAAQQNEEWSEAIDTLAQLPQEVRVPIILKHYYGYAYEEIAEMMDLPAGTVKSRIHNGLKQIRKEMDADE
jgi:RNA polymerase sigma-70 factor (ECF subfamily)